MLSSIMPKEWGLRTNLKEQGSESFQVAELVAVWGGWHPWRGRESSAPLALHLSLCISSTGLFLSCSLWSKQIIGSRVCLWVLWTTLANGWTPNSSCENLWYAVSQTKVVGNITWGHTACNQCLKCDQSYGTELSFWGVCALISISIEFNCSRTLCWCLQRIREVPGIWEGTTYFLVTLYCEKIEKRIKQLFSFPANTIIPFFFLAE